VATPPAARANHFQRVADVPVYFADPLVRRATSLQKTVDAASPVARMSSETMATLGVQHASRVRIKGKTGEGVDLLVEADENLASGCIRIAAAHVSTVALGPLHGELSVERL
jgi:NADH-quinone oxidoreductase subunit G